MPSASSPAMSSPLVCSTHEVGLVRRNRLEVRAPAVEGRSRGPRAGSRRTGRRPRHARLHRWRRGSRCRWGRDRHDPAEFVFFCRLGVAARAGRRHNGKRQQCPQQSQWQGRSLGGGAVHGVLPSARVQGRAAGAPTARAAPYLEESVREMAAGRRPDSSPEGASPLRDSAGISPASLTTTGCESRARPGREGLVRSGLAGAGRGAANQPPVADHDRDHEVRAGSPNSPGR